jgi:ion channel
MQAGTSVLEQLRDALRRHVSPRRHTVLLVALVALLGMRALFGDARIGQLVVFNLALLSLLVVSLYTIQVDELAGERETLLAQRRRQSIVGWLLIVPALADRLAIMFMPSRPVVIVGTIFWLLFFSFITLSELRAVVKQRDVTGETIAMSISVYLLLGLTWACFYIVLYYLQPNAFNFAGSSSKLEVQQVFPILAYFSLTTLSTIGFGDITPVSLQARYAAVAEGITGQLYFAILIARLVGLYTIRMADQGSNSR